MNDVPQPGDIDYQPPATAERRVKVSRLDDEDGLLTQEYAVCAMHYDELWDAIHLVLDEHFGIKLTEVK